MSSFLYFFNPSTRYNNIKWYEEGTDSLAEVQRMGEEDLSWEAPTNH